MPTQPLSRRRAIPALALAALATPTLPACTTPPEPPPATCTPPPALADALPVATPAALGFDTPALCAALHQIRTAPTNLHAILILRHGTLVAELYRPGPDRSLHSLWSSHTRFGPETLHDLRSISKSVTSLLYGILLHRGDVPALDTPVPALFPEHPHLADPARQAIRIRHLLTMSAGLDWTEPSPVRRVTASDEGGLTYRSTAYPYVFARPVTAPPGEVFTYSGGLTAVLAEIMVRATGRPLRDIAATELFTPLGITSWEWVGNLFGTPLAAAGLRLRPRDLLKIGAMMLNGGTWQGRQIVPAAWITESTAPHIPAQPLGAYGFQWWATATPWRGQSLPTATAIGNGGQRLALVPALGLAIAITAGDYNSPAINPVLDELQKTLVATIQA